MSKAQTDIRATSYDELAARPDGYQGSIDSVIAQIRGEGGWQSKRLFNARVELLQYLGVKSTPSEGPSVELDQDVSYGAEDVTLGVYDPGFYSLAHAKARGWL
jgi:hypothetical protein